MLSCFTGLFSTYAGTDSKVGNAMCIVSLFLWVTFYATCIDAVSFVYCSEIFPTQMRSQGVAASVAGLFTVTLSKHRTSSTNGLETRLLTKSPLPVLTQVAATAFAEVGWKFYLTFIIVPAAGLPVLWQFPETKGLTLEEISALFEDEGAPPDTAIASDLEKEYRVSGNSNLDELWEMLTVARFRMELSRLSRILQMQDPLLSEYKLMLVSSEGRDRSRDEPMPAFEGGQ